jgi:SAM-dependent methyltransferase
MDSRFQNHEQQVKILDLAAGTGLVTKNILDYYPLTRRAYFTLLDSNQEMLEQAKQNLLDSPSSKNAPAKTDRFYFSTDTITAFEKKHSHDQDQCFDFIFIGSAWHWLVQNTDNALAIIDLLKPNGLLYVFEYQVPKFDLYPTLNEWLRRQFNTKWRAPDQIPRGTLNEITKCFTEKLKLEAESNINYKSSWTTNELAGFIISQSRYLHWENTLPENARAVSRLELIDKIHEFVDQRSPVIFEMPYQGLLYSKQM